MLPNEPPDAVRRQPSPTSSTPADPPSRSPDIPRNLDVRLRTNPARRVLLSLIGIVLVTALIAGAILMGPAMWRRAQPKPPGNPPRHSPAAKTNLLTLWMQAAPPPHPAAPWQRPAAIVLVCGAATARLDGYGWVLLPAYLAGEDAMRRRSYQWKASLAQTHNLGVKGQPSGGAGTINSSARASWEWRELAGKAGDWDRAAAGQIDAQQDWVNHSGAGEGVTGTSTSARKVEVELWSLDARERQSAMRAYRDALRRSLLADGAKITSEAEENMAGVAEERPDGLPSFRLEYVLDRATGQVDAEIVDKDGKRWLVVTLTEKAE
jgi:hypothetical protein